MKLIKSFEKCEFKEIKVFIFFQNYFLDTCHFSKLIHLIERLYELKNVSKIFLSSEYKKNQSIGNLNSKIDFIDDNSDHSEIQIVFTFGGDGIILWANKFLKNNFLIFH